MNRSEELQAVLAGNVESVREAVADMGSLDDLAELRTLEEAAVSPRKGVFDAIEKREDALTAPPAEAEAAAAPAAELTFRDAAYTGPMTGEQAAWRNANLKPVGEVVTK